MTDVSRATLLGLGLSTLILVTCCVVGTAAGAADGVKIELIDSLSKSDIQELLTKAKGYTLIEITNQVGSGIEVQCEAGSGLQSLGRTKVPDLYEYAFYFNPSVRMHDQYSCDVFVDNNQTHFEVYNQKELKNTGNSFKITKFGVLQNGEEVQNS